ncbi:MAG: hypothetical protein ACRDH2_06585 [Anaerolineales bacterium]
MNLTRKTYLTRNEKIIDFVIGFVGWFVVNSVLGGIVGVGLGLLGSLTANSADPTLQNIVGVVSLALNCIPLIINLGALVYFALTRYWIALGALAAFGLVLVAVICAAVFLGVACLVILSGASGGLQP